MKAQTTSSAAGPAKFVNVLSEQVSDSPSAVKCSPEVRSIWAKGGLVRRRKPDFHAIGAGTFHRLKVRRELRGGACRPVLGDRPINSDGLARLFISKLGRHDTTHAPGRGVMQ